MLRAKPARMSAMGNLLGMSGEYTAKAFYALMDINVSKCRLLPKINNKYHFYF